MSLDDARQRVRAARSPSRNGTAAPAPPAKPTAEADDALVVGSLAGIVPEPVRFLVPGYIPRGMMGMIAGEGGHGKSATTLELAAALSVGRCAFGLSYPNPARGKTLLISCEDDWARTIVPRLAALGADRSKILRVEGVRMKASGKVLDFHLGHYEQLKRALEADPEIRLVIVDPAGAYIGRAGVNENHDADLRAVLGPLSEAANSTDTTVLLIKHLNKSAGVSAVQRVGGSAGYVNAVRFAFMLAPCPDDGDKKLLLPMKANVLPSRTAGLAFRMAPLAQEEASAILLREWPDMTAADVTDLASQLFRQAWEGSVTADADSVAGRKRSGSGSSNSRETVDACVTFIREFLGEYAWPDAELEQAVTKAKFSIAALKAAKAQMRGESKTDPTRLSSRPSGEGGAWWQWIGSQYDRPLDRPLPSPLLSLVRETGETGETEKLERLKTEDCDGRSGCDGSPHIQSIQKVSSVSLAKGYPPVANQRDCSGVGEGGTL